MSNGSSPTSDWEQGYGFQFWRCRHGFYRGDGAHGQFCIVMPQYDAVVAITSGTRDMASVMNLVWDRLVPAFEAGPLAPDDASATRLRARLSGLVLHPEAGSAGASAAKSVVGKRYVIETNPRSIDAITLASIDVSGGAVFTFKIAGAEQRISARPGAWQKGTMVLDGLTQPTAASGGWTAADTYTLKVARYRTPFVTTYRLRFTGDRLEVESEENVGAPETRIAKLSGTLERMQ